MATTFWNLSRVLIALCVVTLMSAEAQTITTIAGIGTSGFNGDGIPATSAELNGPVGVAVDVGGNVYIADIGNNRHRKVFRNGTIATIAGNGAVGYNGDGIPATAAELNYPYGVALDTSGNVYISDVSNERIRKVFIDGTIASIAGTGTAGYNGDGILATAAELYGPWGVTVDSNGNVYIADFYNNRIRKVLVNGMIATVAGNGAKGYNGDGIPATAAELNWPSGVTVDNSGNVFIADVSNNRIRKLFANGSITTLAGTGTAGYNGDGIHAIAAMLNGPSGVAVDDFGNVYIADGGNSRIRKVLPNGTIITIAGNGISGFNGDGISATAAELNVPNGVAVDAIGNLYIADGGNSRIRMVALAVTPFVTLTPASSVAPSQTGSPTTAASSTSTVSSTASTPTAASTFSTTVSVTASAAPTTATATDSASATVTATSTLTPSCTTSTGTPSLSSSGSPTRSYSPTPSASHTATPSSSHTGTPSSSYTSTPSSSHSGTPSSSHSGTPSSTPSITPSHSQTTSSAWTPSASTPLPLPSVGTAAVSLELLAGSVELFYSYPTLQSKFEMGMAAALTFGFNYTILLTAVAAVRLEQAIDSPSGAHYPARRVTAVSHSVLLYFTIDLTNSGIAASLAPGDTSTFGSTLTTRLLVAIANNATWNATLGPAVSLWMSLAGGTGSDQNNVIVSSVVVGSAPVPPPGIPLAPVIGGCIGGIAFVLLVLYGVGLGELMRRRKNNISPSGVDKVASAHPWLFCCFRGYNQEAKDRCTLLELIDEENRLSIEFEQLIEEDARLQCDFRAHYKERQNDETIILCKKLLEVRKRRADTTDSHSKVCDRIASLRTRFKDVKDVEFGELVHNANITRERIVARQFAVNQNARCDAAVHDTIVANRDRGDNDAELEGLRSSLVHEMLVASLSKSAAVHHPVVA